MNYPAVVTRTIKPFAFVRVSSAQEAVSVLHQHGGRAKVLAGGTDLLPQMKQRDVTPEFVIDLKGIKGMADITIEKDVLRIGALTTIARLLTSPDLARFAPSLQMAAKTFATPQVRNIATIGGNICRSSPSADTVPPLLTFDAQVEIVGSTGVRWIALEEFFTGPGANILDAEVVTAILVPVARQTSASWGSAFAKITRNTADLAKVNAAAMFEVIDGRFNCVRVAVGAVAPTPVRAVHVEQALEGQFADAKTIAAMVGNEVSKDISPISDVRSDAAYRMDVTRVLVNRVLSQAVTNLMPHA